MGCSGGQAHWATWKLELEFIEPGHSSPLLFYSPDQLTGESLGVVTGSQDEFGFAKVVLTKKGEPPVFSTILADTALEPADRIVDIVLLEANPNTGLNLYGAFLEY